MNTPDRRPPARAVPSSAAGARVVDEGPHHAVLYKPAGMTVVAGRGVQHPTLLDVAQERFPGARPVHRLDRVTAGICVVAKSLFGQQALSEAFRRHLIDKRYLAVVEGSPAFEKLDIDARLARIDEPDAKKGPLAHQTIDEGGVRALTRVRVLARGDGAALLECRPETGRMHQIRCHLAHVGHPIVGDALYGAKRAYLDARGIALIALAISFPLPQGGRAFVAGPLPPELSATLASAGIDAAPIALLVEKFRANASASAPKRAPPTKPLAKARGKVAARTSPRDPRAGARGKQRSPKRR